MSEIDPTRGFFALITVVMVGFLFLFAVLLAAEQGISGRLMLIAIENKLESESYAEACIQRARISVVNDPLRSITAPSITPVGAGTCTVVSLTPHMPLPGQSTIYASSTVSGATTNIEAVIDGATGDVLLWKEIPIL